MESEKNGLKFWLKARTIGLCACFNRLLGYHPVRATRPVIFVSSMFIRDNEHSNRRTEHHLARYPEYPNPVLYLGHLGKYFFRDAESLLHLRVEQFNRYLIMSDTHLSGADSTAGGCTADDFYEDGDDADDEERYVEVNHRHFDNFMEQEPPGKRYPARMRGAYSAKRREHSKLAVSRYANPEPIGQTREAFYQQRLLLALAWYADSVPEVDVAARGEQSVRWTLKWARPPSLARRALPDIIFQISSTGSSFSYEERAHHFETLFSCSEFVCKCCDGEIGPLGPCDACRYAVGFHICPESGIAEHRWCRASLFGGLNRVLVSCLRLLVLRIL